MSVGSFRGIRFRRTLFRHVTHAAAAHFEILFGQDCMEEWFSAKTIFLLISAVAIASAIWHFRVFYALFRSIDATQERSRESNYVRRQLRRRIQIAMLIGVSGVCMFFGVHLSHTKSPGWFVLTWGLAMVFLIWTMLLAMVDMMSIRLHFRRARSKNIAEELKIRYELEKATRAQHEKETDVDAKSR